MFAVESSVNIAMCRSHFKLFYDYMKDRRFEEEPDHNYPSEIWQCDVIGCTLPAHMNFVGSTPIVFTPGKSK